MDSDKRRGGSLRLFKRKEPALQIVLGSLCCLLDIIGLVSSFSLQSWLGPGAYSGFFLILAGALGCLAMRYPFERSPVILFFLQICALFALCIAFIAVAMELARVANLSPAERKLYSFLTILTVTRALLIVVLIISCGFTLDLLLQNLRNARNAGLCVRKRAGSSTESQSHSLTKYGLKDDSSTSTVGSEMYKETEFNV